MNSFSYINIAKIIIFLKQEFNTNFMAKIFIKTFGCQSNIADSEQIAGILKKNKHKIVNTIEKADIIVLNSCSVKNSTQSSQLHFIGSIPKNKNQIQRF